VTEIAIHTIFIGLFFPECINKILIQFTNFVIKSEVFMEISIEGEMNKELTNLVLFGYCTTYLASLPIRYVRNAYTNK